MKVVVPAYKYKDFRYYSVHDHSDVSVGIWVVDPVNQVNTQSADCWSPFEKVFNQYRSNSLSNLSNMICFDTALFTDATTHLRETGLLTS